MLGCNDASQNLTAKQGDFVTTLVGSGEWDSCSPGGSPAVRPGLGCERSVSLKEAGQAAAGLRGQRRSPRPAARAPATPAPRPGPAPSVGSAPLRKCEPFSFHVTGVRTFYRDSSVFPRRPPPTPTSRETARGAGAGGARGGRDGRKMATAALALVSKLPATRRFAQLAGRPPGQGPPGTRRSLAASGRVRRGLSRGRSFRPADGCFRPEGRAGPGLGRVLGAVQRAEPGPFAGRPSGPGEPQPRGGARRPLSPSAFGVPCGPDQGAGCLGEVAFLLPPVSRGCRACGAGEAPRGAWPGRLASRAGPALR